MKAYLASNFIGVFAFDGNKNILTYRLFQKSATEIASKLQATQLLGEEKEVLEDLKKSGYTEVSMHKPVAIEGLTCIYEKDNMATKVLNAGFRKIAVDVGFSESQQELNMLLSKVNIELTKSQLQKPKKDKVIMTVIGIIDELDKTTNNFAERLKEWYGLHSPEIVRSLASNQKFVEIIAECGHRDRVKDRLKVKGSSGMDFEKEDIDALQAICSSVESLYKKRDSLAKYIEGLCKETIPNTSAIAGPLLAARMLQLSGGLDKMARMPSSTIQLLGAEKALFRHMKENAKTPKYGVLFAHPLIQNSKKENRGKIARLIAAKLSLAARIDAYSERDDGERMRKELDEIVSKL